jgi:hypothetical protein
VDDAATAVTSAADAIFAEGLLGHADRVLAAWAAAGLSRAGVDGAVKWTLSESSRLPAARCAEGGDVFELPAGT